MLSFSRANLCYVIFYYSHVFKINCWNQSIIYDWSAKYFIIKWYHFLIRQLNRVFCVLKRTVSLRQFFGVHTTYVLTVLLSTRNMFWLGTKKLFLLHTLIWRPVFCLWLIIKSCCPPSQKDLFWNVLSRQVVQTLMRPWCVVSHIGLCWLWMSHFWGPYE